MFRNNDFFCAVRTKQDNFEKIVIPRPASRHPVLLLTYLIGYAFNFAFGNSRGPADPVAFTATALIGLVTLTSKWVNWLDGLLSCPFRASKAFPFSSEVEARDRRTD